MGLVGSSPPDLSIVEGAAPRVGRSGWNIPWWVIILIVGAVGFIFVILSNPVYQQIFNLLVFGRPNSGATEGLLLTIRITLIGFVVATVIGLLAGLARVSKNQVIYNVATLYVEVVRGVPLVV